MLTKTNTQRFLFVLYIAAVIVSLLVSDVKFRSLGFHTRDYPFYLQFASKLLDGNSIREFSINPDGKNWLFMEGFEGVTSFHQSVHFEPVKYLYALLYKLAPTPYTLFLFISLIFFLPVLYLAMAAPLGKEHAMRKAIALGLFYVIFPSAVFVPSFDLRPYIFLAPFFLLAFMSIKFSRPAWEQVLFFNLLFFAREEAIILGATILLYAFAKTQDRLLSASTFWALCASYATWTVATIVYLRWSGYPILIEKLPFRVFNPLKRLDAPETWGLFAAILVGLALLAGLWFYWKKLQSMRYFQPIIEILAIGTVLVPLGYQFVSEYDPNWLDFVFFSARYFLHFTAFMVLVWIAWDHIKPEISAKAWSWIMGVGIVVVLLLNLTSSYNLPASYARFNANIPAAGEVWAFADTLGPYTTEVLVDYSTLQAFYNFNHVYAYNRLPWQLAEGEARYYPANSDVLNNMMVEKILYIVASTQSRQDIDTILNAGNLTSKSVFEIDGYFGLELDGGK